MAGPLGLDREYFHSPDCDLPTVAQLRLLQCELDWAVTRGYGRPELTIFNSSCDDNSSFGVGYEGRMEMRRVLESFAADNGHPTVSPRPSDVEPQEHQKELFVDRLFSDTDGPDYDS